MIKSILILISLSTFLFSSQQIVLVVADDFNVSKAKLELFDDSKKLFRTIDVNIGKNGLGWGLGEVILDKKSGEPLKYEGDKKAPIGVFKLSSVFSDKKSEKYKMPHLFTSKDLICVDESSSKHYNKILQMPKEKPKSFEFMKRDDNQYKLGIVVEHNKEGEKQRGSCIFIHVEKTQNSPTAGCTSMKMKDLRRIVSWLDESKNPILIQIPKSLSGDILKLYPELKNSELLKR